MSRHAQRCRLPLLILFFFCLSFLCTASASEPLRIVSQTVATDELLLEVADSAQIAALSQLARDAQFSAVSKEARAYPCLPLNADAEAILKYRPDLVLFGDFSRAELVAQIQRCGVEVFIFSRYNTLDETWGSLRLLAKKIGPRAEVRAEQTIADCQRRIAVLQEKLRSVKPVRVISPSTYDLLPGDQTNFQDYCEHAGAENLAKTIGGFTGQVPPPGEQLLNWPVEKVVVIGDTGDGGALPDAGQIEKALRPFTQMTPYRFMPAVREKRVALLNIWQSSCISHYRVSCYEFLARQLHPEVFAEGEKTGAPALSAREVAPTTARENVNEPWWAQGGGTGTGFFFFGIAAFIAVAFAFFAFRAATSTTSRRVVPLVAVAVLFALAFASLAMGDVPLTPAEFLRGLLRKDIFFGSIIWELRMPRLLIAVLCGAALASSGLVMQAFFRNGLASPGLLGVSAGATAGAVGVIGIGGLAAQSLFVLPTAAIAGAFVATVLVLQMARGGAGTERLLLAGIALNAMLGAVSSYVLSSTTITFERNAQILFWMLGGLEARTWEHVLMGAPIVIAVALLCPLGRPMDLLSLGRKEAQSLGVDVPRLQRKLIVLSTVLTALATAVSGTVGFVGLVVPHILRLLLGAEHRRLVPCSIVCGAAFMVACDILGRCAGGLRIGIVTALIGGPFFLWLLRRK
ncbi:MAG: iron chelate uptake ABC transporter family permease subunit [Puniceicoccales bacterium]|nr:iron chelate uptake ABC transporter family permease subunit [Puniceicoccales bacterium]